MWDLPKLPPKTNSGPHTSCSLHHLFHFYFMHVSPPNNFLRQPPQSLTIILNNRITHDDDHEISQLFSLSTPSHFSPNLGFPTTKNCSPLRFLVSSYILTQSPHFLLPSPLTYSTCHLPLSVSQKTPIENLLQLGLGNQQKTS